MDSVTDLMMQRFEKKKTRGGINGPFQEAVAQVMGEIKNVDPKTGQEWSFGRWCGYLRNVPAYDILSFLQIAKKANHVGRHFNWQVKEYKKKYGK